MKTLHQFLSFSLLLAMLALGSCKKDNDTPVPAPQVTSDKTSLALASGATDDLTLTIVAPGSFSTVTATADNGTVTLSDVTGTGTITGTAKITYDAPDDVGNFTITVTVTDGSTQTGTLSIGVAVTAKPPVHIPAGHVSGTWEKNTIYIADGSLEVPEGESLTIEEGVTVIFDGDGSQGSAEFAVSGSLYSYGTADKPVLFTVPEAKRIKANIFAGLWGGVQATSTATAMVLQYTNIEFGGAPAGEGNASVASGAYTAGTLRYGLLFSKNDGKFVMQHSRIAYTKDDGMRILGGTVLITDNFFESCGSTGGESVNIKSGTTGDVSFNVIYNCATNGMKISNVSGSSPTPQTNINVYNNTVVNSGWRQTATSAHGGSINMEKGARGQIYNNLVANCKFGTRVTSDADYVTNINEGYNLYYGHEQVIVDGFYPTSTIIKSGDKETASDVVGLVNVNDPKFVTFDVTTFVSANAPSTDLVDFIGAHDFHLQVGSPALTKGKTGFTVGTSVTVDGHTYNVPVPTNYIGAMSTN